MDGDSSGRMSVRGGEIWLNPARKNPSIVGHMEVNNAKDKSITLDRFKRIEGNMPPIQGQRL